MRLAMGNRTVGLVGHDFLITQNARTQNPLIGKSVGATIELQG